MINNKKGIYVITCKINGKKYVGYTMDSFIKRWSYHVADFQTGINNKNMQKDFNKYGLLNFDMEILEEIEYGSREYFIQREQHWMAVLATINPKYGYNIIFGNYGEKRKHRPMKEFAETKKKLTREQVNNIREELKEDTGESLKYKYIRLAKKYNVSHGLIGLIKNNKHWTDREKIE